MKGRYDDAYRMSSDERGGKKVAVRQEKDPEDTEQSQSKQPRSICHE